MLRDVVAIEIRDEIKRKKELNSFYATVFLSAVIHLVGLLIYTILILPGQYKHEELFEVSMVETTAGGGGGGGSSAALDVKPQEQPAEEEVPLPKVPIVKAAPVPKAVPTAAQNVPAPVYTPRSQQNYPRSGYSGSGGGQGTGTGSGTGSGTGPGSGSGTGGGAGSGNGPGTGPGNGLGSMHNTSSKVGSQVIEPQGIAEPRDIGGIYKPAIVRSNQSLNGEVSILIYISRDGKVYKTEIYKPSSNPGVDEGIRKAYLEMVFEIPMKDGKPTEAKIVHVVRYSYDKAGQ